VEAQLATLHTNREVQPPFGAAVLVNLLLMLKILQTQESAEQTNFNLDICWVEFLED